MTLDVDDVSGSLYDRYPQRLEHRGVRPELTVHVMSEDVLQVAGAGLVLSYTRQVRSEELLHKLTQTLASLGVSLL